MEGRENGAYFEKETALAAKELTPENRNEVQIRLATELYLREHPEADLGSPQTHNDIMMYWVENGYSSKYRELEESAEFAFHPRLGGDIFKLTADDVEHFAKTGNFSE